MALGLDFRRLLADQGGSVGHGIRKPHLLSKRCWDWLFGDQSFFERPQSNNGKYKKHGIRELHSILKSYWVHIKSKSPPC